MSSNDDLDALREEYQTIQTLGHRIRAERYHSLFDGYARRLALEKLSPGDPEFGRLQGRCEMLKELLEYDAKVVEEWERHVAGEEREEEVIEGGPVAPNYEAAR